MLYILLQKIVILKLKLLSNISWQSQQRVMNCLAQVGDNFYMEDNKICIYIWLLTLIMRQKHATSALDYSNNNCSSYAIISFVNSIDELIYILANYHK